MRADAGVVAAWAALALVVLAWPGRWSGRLRDARTALSDGPIGRETRPAGAASSDVTTRTPSTDEVATAMVLLAVALQSGCGVVEAIDEVAAVGPAPAARELSVVAAALRWGVPDDRAWGAASPTWSRAALALRLAAVSGVAPSTLLASGAEDLRFARLAAVEVAAARLGVRLVLPLGLAFLPAFVLTTVVPVVLALARQVLS